MMRWIAFVNDVVLFFNYEMCHEMTLLNWNGKSETEIKQTLKKNVRNRFSTPSLSFSSTNSILISSRASLAVCSIDISRLAADMVESNSLLCWKITRENDFYFWNFLMSFSLESMSLLGIDPTCRFYKTWENEREEEEVKLTIGRLKRFAASLVQSKSLTMKFGLTLITFWNCVDIVGRIKIDFKSCESKNHSIKNRLNAARKTDVKEIQNWNMKTKTKSWQIYLINSVFLWFIYLFSVNRQPSSVFIIYLRID